MHGLFGPHQYAYSKDRSYKDVLLVNTCQWISLLERGFMVGVYCSDVSGAFDRVVRYRMCRKLEVSGLHPRIVAFLSSWLDDRVSQVVVGGACSNLTSLVNSVFQGTVLGPPLWNIFYADVKKAINRKNFIETIFADNFNC